MANFSAKEVNELRKSTGVGIMDCKKALIEADGDVEKAITILREKGLATQAKKAGRVAAEGLVAAIVNEDHSVGAIVEVNSETDFVAKNAEFKEFVNNVAKTVIEQNPADLDALNNAKMSGSDKTVAESLQDLFLKIRENLQIRRFERLEGILVPYVHGDGKIGVLVQAACEAGAKPEVLTVAKDCALQIAAMNPAYLCREEVPASAEDPKMASKPEQVRVKIVEGKVGKYYSENCLLEQDFVKDPSMSITEYANSVAKTIGSDIKITKFVRYERGEGIEKRADNFADEVASMIK